MHENQENSKEPKFQTETIKGLVIIFYKNLLIGGPKQYTTAYSICRAMAKRFNEAEHLEKLERLYKKTTIGYPLGLIQTIVFRDIITGKSTNKTYNYGIHARPVMLGDMILALDNVNGEILDIFTEICVKHDIDTTFAMPMIEGLDLGRHEGL